MFHNNEEFDENMDTGNIEFSSNQCMGHALDNDLGDHTQVPYTFGCQTKQPDFNASSVQARRSGNLTINKEKANCISTENNCLQCTSALEPLCHIKLESLNKLKDSTIKLLCLLEGIQKTHPKNSNSSDLFSSVGTDLTKPIPTANPLPAVINFISSSAKQETQNEDLDAINIEEDEEDDCSVYKRLTRKCHCLNRLEYNDFIIHFNESTKYFTSTMGEIIKNMRYLKKFLYMGGEYARHALMFLNEGFSYSTHMEKVEITQGCAHADICNVFDDQSIIIVCIFWPSDCENCCGDPSTQALTASFLNKLVQLEEGRRYLKFSSKITSELKKVIRKNAAKLEFETLELLNSTLNILNPPMALNTNVTYYCKPVDEGFGSKTVTALLKYREHMTLEEVLTHLDLLHNLSNSENGRRELTSFLPTLLNLFTQTLKEYDNSEINIIVTNILNNIVSRSMIQPLTLPRTVVMADTATEGIQMKNETNQVPTKKNIKTEYRNKAGKGIPPYNIRQPCKDKVKGWELPTYKSRHVTKDPNCSVIVVPIEE